MPASTYRCENQTCAHHGVDRTVASVEVGPGLFSDPPVQCECGQHPRRVARVHSEAPAAPERAVRRQPEKRGGRRG